MEYLIGFIKLIVIAAIIYCGYYFYTQSTTSNQPVTYNIEKEVETKEIEAPSSVVGMTFTSDDGFIASFTSESSCKITNIGEDDGFEIKGNPTYSYKKKDNTKAILKISYIATRNKGREILEDDCRYEFEMSFNKPTSGKAHCNYILTHKIGVGDNVKSYIEADTRPTWFKLK